MSATHAGLAYALIAVTGLFYGAEYQLPRSVGPLGRWPGLPERLGDEPARVQVETTGRDEAAGSAGRCWSGVRRHLQGDLEGALAPLREAFVQQQSGEGLFRSETTAELIFALCELGELARGIDHPA